MELENMATLKTKNAEFENELKQIKKEIIDLSKNKLKCCDFFLTPRIWNIINQFEVEKAREEKNKLKITVQRAYELYFLKATPTTEEAKQMKDILEETEKELNDLKIY